MGLSKDMRQAMDKWLEEAKVEIMEKLKSVCTNLEDRLVGMVQRLEEKVVKLEEENSGLRGRMEMLERYERGDCLEIHNVPKTDHESVEELVLSVADAMGVEMTAADISTAYRLPVKRGRENTAVPRIYVKFTKRSLKRSIYGNRIKQKVTHDKLGLGTDGKIYIHEHLSKTQNDLFYKAKDKVRETSYKFIWTQDQRIYVRDNTKSKRISIDTEADLDMITRGSPRKLRSDSRANSSTPHNLR
mgnify:FL=1